MKKQIRARIIAGKDTFTVVADSNWSQLHTHAQAWMTSRAKDKRPVYGAKLVPFGLQFSRLSWRLEDVKAVLERLKVRLV